VRYFLLLFLIFGALAGTILLSDLLAQDRLLSDVLLIIDTPLTANPVADKLFNSLCIAFFILVLYTIGIYLIVRKIPDVASRLTAVRIFSVILVAIGLLVGMLEWVTDPAQIVLILGILWGAAVVALRDVIQNMIGSLLVLVSRMFRIGDRIHIRDLYGVVMDIGVFRTTLMILDEEYGDRPSGKVTTIPNGIIFREIITNSRRQFSFMEDEIRVSIPLSADIVKVRTIINEIVEKHTREFQEQARNEAKNLSGKKFLPHFNTEPGIFISFEYGQILIVVKYCTEVKNRAMVKNRIVEDIMQRMPEITQVNL